VFILPGIDDQGSQTVVVAKPAANNAAAALTQLLSKHLIGANVRNASNRILPQ